MCTGCFFPPPQPQRGRQPTLGGQFKVSLQELYAKLQSTCNFPDLPVTSASPAQLSAACKLLLAEVESAKAKRDPKKSGGAKPHALRAATRPSYARTRP